MQERGREERMEREGLLILLSVSTGRTTDFSGRCCHPDDSPLSIFFFHPPPPPPPPPRFVQFFVFVFSFLSLCLFVLCFFGRSEIRTLKISVLSYNSDG